MINRIKNNYTLDPEVNDEDLLEVPGEVLPIEMLIYDWVTKNYGGAEASNPSWDIIELAKFIHMNYDDVMNGRYEQKNTVAYEL